jgi:hypothetical protein
MFKTLVTFDTDAINQNNRHYEVNRPSFEYGEELRELCSFLALEGVKATAFVRVDQQVEKHFGYRHVLEKVLSSVERGGRPAVEVGWHPHIYATNAGAYEVARDEALVAELLAEVYASVDEVRLMKCVRLGGTQGGNLIMKTLDGFGFEVDSSANPGRSMSDAHRHFDWSRCTNSPYHPSADDYQGEKSGNYRILEVPITTIPLEAPYDQAPKARAVNPCYRHELFARAIRENERALKELGFCVMLFHPDELIEGYGDDLLLYGFNNFRRNFEFFRQTMGDIEFLTMGEFGRKIGKPEGDH